MSCRETSRATAACFAPGFAALTLLVALPSLGLAHHPSKPQPPKAPTPPVACTSFQTDPASGLVGHPHVSEITATLFTTGSPRCQIDFTFSSRGGPEHGYEPDEKQRIRIRVGLPLNSVDGGTGGVEGAWNGKTRHLGGGGCAGSLGGVTGATGTGYVGSSTDTGHAGGDCLFALQPNPKRLNVGRLKDFIEDSIIAQVRWGKSIAATYYGTAPKRNYWDGCSTGGRQGFAIAQKYPEELDGWLVGAPAVNWARFRLQNSWAQLVMKDVVGGPISTAKFNQVNTSVVAACDALDGVTDGILNDPRRCTWSAKNNICGAPGAPTTNCLDEAEATAIDLIWDGARNSKGTKVFPGFLRGASFSFTAANPPNAAPISQFAWNHADASFDWRTVAMTGYGEEAELGSKTHGDLVNTMSTSLHKLRNRGGKILMWHGEADSLITTENSRDYYVRVAAEFGRGHGHGHGHGHHGHHGHDDGTPDFGALQSWFRYFRAPGVAHCGGGNGPQPQALFETMVKWVEEGVAPDQILASGGGRTRPLCPFPQTAIYNGTGDSNDAANFHCGGNLQTRAAICQGLVARYKRESHKAVDSMGRYNLSTCFEHGHHHGH